MLDSHSSIYYMCSGRYYSEFRSELEVVPLGRKNQRLGFLPDYSASQVSNYPYGQRMAYLAGHTRTPTTLKVPDDGEWYLSTCFNNCSFEIKGESSPNVNIIVIVQQWCL